MQTAFRVKRTKYSITFQRPGSRVITATVVSKKEKAFGVAICHPKKDKFNLEKGQKHALGQALSQLFTSKKIRKAIWEQVLA